MSEIDKIPVSDTEWDVRAVIDFLRRHPPSGTLTWPEAPDLSVFKSAARRAGWELFVVDPDKPTKKSFLNACKKTFDFPSYFGHNWDALADSLSDVDHSPENGSLVLWMGWDEFSEEEPDDFETALDVMTEGIGDWSTKRIPAALILPG